MDDGSLQLQDFDYTISTHRSENLLQHLYLMGVPHQGFHPLWWNLVYWEEKVDKNLVMSNGDVIWKYFSQMLLFMKSMPMLQ